MKKIKFFSMMVAVLIVAMSVGFTSCSKDNEEPEGDYSFYLMGNWYCNLYNNHTGWGETVASLTFNADGTYSYNIYGEYSYNIDRTYVYVPENERSIEGMYNIVESKKTTLVLYELDGTKLEYDATLFKMLASGSSVFDQLWVYALSEGGIQFFVHLYSKNELVQELWGTFDRNR